MYCLELIKFDVSINTYYVEVENDSLLRDIVRSWKMIVRGHGKSWKHFREKWWEPCYTLTPTLRAFSSVSVLIS